MNAPSIGYLRSLLSSKLELERSACSQQIPEHVRSRRADGKPTQG